jgi:hypothetical protein
MLWIWLIYFQILHTHTVHTLFLSGLEHKRILLSLYIYYPTGITKFVSESTLGLYQQDIYKKQSTCNYFYMTMPKDLNFILTSIML